MLKEQIRRRILVTGGNGLLAHALKQIAPSDFQLLLLNHAEFDLADAAQMVRQLAVLKPQAVINTAAYNLVDRCEVDRDVSWAINATAPGQLAEICARDGIRLVHYGTDYVFDGAQKSPYSEADAPNPLNHYGAGKLAGEQAVLRASPDNLVLRTSWLFDWHPTQAKTFVHTILKAARERRGLKATTDQVSVPTFASDLAHWTLELIRRSAGGLFHAVNDEGVSRFDWTRVILEEAARAHLIPSVPPVEPVLSSAFSAAMQRPNFTVMNNAKLAGLLGSAPGSWRPGLRKMLAQFN